MTKCIGCGVELQNNNSLEKGYVNDLNNKLCQRCFKINNYGIYENVLIDNKEFTNMIDNINKTNSLVVLVIDLFNFNPDLNIFNNLKNNILLVLTKRDLLPSSLYDEKLLNYINTNLNIVDKIIISSNKNYNFDLLYEKIKNHSNNNDVYVVGYTNAGKSTMINKMVKNYLDSKDYITTSILPNTTLNNLEINFKDFKLIDTPGIIDNNSIYYYLSGKELKKVIPKCVIKPITYQINKKQNIYLDKYVKLEVSNNNITIFSSLKTERTYNEINTNLQKHTIDVSKDEDIVVSGLCFIKFTKKETINIYTLKGVNVYKRKSLI